MDISPEILKKSIESLFRLQEIDAQLFKLFQEEQTLSPQVLEYQSQIVETQKLLKSIERVLRDLDRERRSFELKSLTLSEDLKRAEAKRRDVRNTKEEFAANKEFEAFQKRVADTKKILTEKTELTAQKTLQKEEKEKELADLDSKLKALEAEQREKNAVLQANRDKLNAERNQYISLVDEEVFSLYERVQRIRKGTGIALVNGMICSGCFVSIPPHTKSRLERMEEIITCPSCSRILYLEEDLASTKMQAPGAA